jgi:hypothetical protein
MKKNYFLLFALFLATTTSLAQKTLHVTGKVFERSDDKGTAYVPFASVYYYNYEDSTKLEYFAFTDMSGSYDLGKIVVKKYRIKILAPGYWPKQKNIGNLPTEIPKEWKTDNFTFHFEMKKKADETITPQVFPIKTLTKSSKDKLWDLLRQINSLSVDEKSKTVTTREGSPIRLLLNGFNMQSKQLDKLASLPLEGFKRIEYYDLSNQLQSVYEGVLNIVLIAGESASKVTFEPKEGKKYDIQ